MTGYLVLIGIIIILGLIGWIFVKRFQKIKSALELSNKNLKTITEQNLKLKTALDKREKIVVALKEKEDEIRHADPSDISRLLNDLLSDN